jgi:hypothetical protein
MTTTFETSRAAGHPATLDGMATAQFATSRARHQSRPGRSVLVAASLEDLRGATRGRVELPIWLFWYPDRTFDLDEPGMLRWMYQIVLREARTPADLAYLNGEALTALWPDLYLPGGVRRAWEEQHQVLRDAVPAQA